jgi:hypothetical protein
LDKANFKKKLVRRDKEGQEDIMILNIYALNMGAQNFLKK